MSSQSRVSDLLRHSCGNFNSCLPVGCWEDRTQRHVFDKVMRGMSDSKWDRICSELRILEQPKRYVATALAAFVTVCQPGRGLRPWRGASDLTTSPSICAQSPFRWCDCLRSCELQDPPPSRPMSRCPSFKPRYYSGSSSSLLHSHRALSVPSFPHASNSLCSFVSRYAHTHQEKPPLIIWLYYR